MNDLAEFLLARIAEDEAVARSEVERLRGAPRRGGKTTAARRWAECEAKRRIVELHARERDPDGDDAGDTCAACSSNGPDAQGWPCTTMRLLALPYADHPDYRPEWRP